MQELRKDVCLQPLHYLGPRRLLHLQQQAAEARAGSGRLQAVALPWGAAWGRVGGGLGEAEDGWVQGCTQVQQFARSFLLFLRRLRSYSIAGGSAVAASSRSAAHQHTGGKRVRGAVGVSTQ
jgi:hypothetical protein